MNPKVNISLKIVPFGNLNYEIKSSNYPMEKKKMEPPRYVEPLTTHIEKVEIHYKDGETFVVPKTTA